VHEDLRSQDRTVEVPAGLIPVRVYWPPQDGETGPAGGGVHPRRRLAGADRPRPEPTDRAAWRRCESHCIDLRNATAIFEAIFRHSVT
jgi:hypothetical protein